MNTEKLKLLESGADARALKKEIEKKKKKQRLKKGENRTFAYSCTLDFSFMTQRYVDGTHRFIVVQKLGLDHVFHLFLQFVMHI